jgi:hypothetical protein
MLIAAALDTDIPTASGDSTTDADSLTTVAFTRTRVPVVLAASDQVDGRDRLVLFQRADAGSLVSAALLAAVMRAFVPAAQGTELEPSRLPEATLAQWRRPAASATTTRSAIDAGTSDGRWLWVLALVLLGVESWMRRGRRQVKAAEVIRERAA